MTGFTNLAAFTAKREVSAEGYYLDSFNYPALRSQLLVPLGPGGNPMYRTQVFDHRADSDIQSPLQIASNNAILLVDGVFLLRNELRELWDFALWVEAPFEVP